jgi:hypothetical protein
MRELGLLGHVASVPARGSHEFGIDLKRRQAGFFSLGVGQIDNTACSSLDNFVWFCSSVGKTTAGTVSKSQIEKRLIGFIAVPN